MPYIRRFFDSFNNSLQATAGAVAFEPNPQPKTAKNQTGRHEVYNMYGGHCDKYAIIQANKWVVAKGMVAINPTSG